MQKHYELQKHIQKRYKQLNSKMYSTLAISVFFFLSFLNQKSLLLTLCFLLLFFTVQHVL